MNAGVVMLSPKYCLKYFRGKNYARNKEIHSMIIKYNSIRGHNNPNCISKHYNR